MGSLPNAGALSYSGSLCSCGALLANGSLSFIGALILRGSLSANGALSANGSLSRIGALTVRGSLVLVGALSLTGSLSNNGALLPTGSLLGPGALERLGSRSSRRNNHRTSPASVRPSRAATARSRKYVAPSSLTLCPMPPAVLPPFAYVCHAIWQDHPDRCQGRVIPHGAHIAFSLAILHVSFFMEPARLDGWTGTTFRMLDQNFGYGIGPRLGAAPPDPLPPPSALKNINVFTVFRLVFAAASFSQVVKHYYRAKYGRQKCRTM